MLTLDPSVNTDVPGTFDLLTGRSGRTSVTLYR